MGERFRLRFGIAPEKIVGQLVIDHLDPHPLALVDAPALPVLRMDQVDTAILEGLAGRLAPIDILVPLDSRALEPKESTKLGDRPPERRSLMVTEKPYQVTVHLAA
jgi:hypothetical protein